MNKLFLQQKHAVTLLLCLAFLCSKGQTNAQIKSQQIIIADQGRNLIFKTFSDRSVNVYSSIAVSDSGYQAATTAWVKFALSNFVNRTTNQTVAGVKTFTDTIKIYQNPLYIETINNATTTFINAKCAGCSFPAFSFSGGSAATVIALNQNSSGSVAENFRIVSSYTDSIWTGQYRPLIIDTYDYLKFRANRGGSTSDTAISFNIGASLANSSAAAFFRNNGTFVINNGLQYKDGNQGIDKIFTSDANGNATWKAQVKDTFFISTASQPIIQVVTAAGKDSLDFKTQTAGSVFGNFTTVTNKPAYSTTPVIATSLGIGSTAQPLGKLDVSGSSVSTDLVAFDPQRSVSVINTNTTTNNAQGIVFRSASTNGTIQSGVKLLGVNTARTTTGLTTDFAILTNANGTITEKMRVTSSGNVGIGVVAPATSALLDITSTTTGILIPRMTNTQQLAIATPTAGLQVYNTTNKRVEFYDGTNWSYVGSEITTAQQAMAILGSNVVADPIPGGVANISTTGPLVNGTLRIMLVYLPKGKTITGVKFFQNAAGVYTANNYNGISISSLSAGTMTIIDSTTNDGNIWKTTANTFLDKPFTAARYLPAGVYAISVLYSTSAETTAPVLGCLPAAPSSGVLNFGLANSVKLSASVNTQTTISGNSTTRLMSNTSASATNFYFGLY